jgi:hypothetical protein
MNRPKSRTHYGMLRTSKKPPMLSEIVAALSDDDEVPLLPASPPIFPGILLPKAQERPLKFCHGSIAEFGNNCESDERSLDNSSSLKSKRARNQLSLI